ncbi:MAG: COX15/CtaA family protein [Rhodospirillales bacterium]|nr:COX15/CtaA family protein [Rhodospirillales bacterium]
MNSATSHNRLVAFWLFSVAIMVFAMIVLGGVTRLTESGLSMVEWRPVTGWLPPFSDSEWERVFGMYRGSPEYREINADMTLPEFKGIFWLEFLHRLWGRLIGLAFFVPFVFFLTKGWVRGRRALALGGILVLGGLQGGMGWYMVKSGLVDRPDVSHYRLAAHLMLAMAIYASLLWCGLRFLSGPTPYREGTVRLRRLSRWLAALVFVTVFSGALVAGLDAGLIYNSFPLMDGELIPDGLLDMQPVYLNLFENHLTVQFDHRVLAIFTFCMIIYTCIVAHKLPTPALARRLANGLAGMACVQVGLGISTLLLAVPVALAALHQAGAVVLLGLATWLAFEMQGACRERKQKIL